MAKIFISHSSKNDAEAVTLRDWLIENGWDDLFLDLDPHRGLKAGERWQEALKAAAERCEVVLFLISPEWAESKWCLAEYLLARQLNKCLIGVLIKPTPYDDLPSEMTAEWQLADLTTEPLSIEPKAGVSPDTKKVTVAFSEDGLSRLKIGLQSAGLDPRYFAWDSTRPPYRGLKPLEAEDAGIFFGRDGAIVTTLDRLRGLRDEAPPRLMVILGASGAGKSSFLRAGLLPRLARDDRHFLPLPVIRPKRAALTGEAGLIASVTAAFKSRGRPKARADVKLAVEGGVTLLKLLLKELVAPPDGHDHSATAGPPTLVLPIDQGEELFAGEAGNESANLLTLVHGLLADDAPAITALFTIRSDSYERLQTDRYLEGLRQHTVSLAPMPRGAYREVIVGPALRLEEEGVERPLRIEEQLTDALLADIEEGGAKDALPLLAFTLERLYAEYGDDGDLKLAEYEALGRIRGSIEAAVERALEASDADARVPKERHARLALLRRGLIPWLAGIDPDTGEPRRRVARASEIPDEARPLIDHLVEQRLLATDVVRETGEVTIEPAHEALLRQWGLLEGWLEEDFEDLAVLEGVKRAARDWSANGENAAWLSHTGGRLTEAERISARPEFAGFISPAERTYIAAAREAEQARVRRERLLNRISRIAAMVAVVGGAIALWQWWEAAQKSEQLLVQTRIAERRTEEAQRQAEIATTQTREAKRLADLAEQSRQRAVAAQAAEKSARQAEAESRRIAEERAFDTRMRAQAAEALALSDTDATAGLKRVAETLEENVASSRAVLPEVHASMVAALRSGRLLRTLTDNLPWGTMASSVAVSPDRQTIVMATASLVYILDKNGRLAAPPLAGPNGWHSYSNQVAWDDKGEMFALVTGTTLSGRTRNATLRIYDRQGQLINSLVDDHTVPILSVIFVPDQRVVLAGDMDGNLIRANIDTAETRIVPSGHVSPIHGMAWTSRGLTLATGPKRSVTGEPDMPDPEPGPEPSASPLDDETIAPESDKTPQPSQLSSDLELEPDAKIERLADSAASGLLCVAASERLWMIATCGADGNVNLWFTHDPALPPQFDLSLRGHIGAVLSVAFHPTADIIATGGADGEIRLWSTAGIQLGSPLRNSNPNSLQGVRALAFVKQGNELWSTNNSGELVVWDTRDLAGEQLNLGFSPDYAVALEDQDDILYAQNTPKPLIGRATIANDGQMETRILYDRQPGEITGVAVSARGNAIAWTSSNSVSAGNARKSGEFLNVSLESKLAAYVAFGNGENVLAVAGIAEINSNFKVADRSEDAADPASLNFIAIPAGNTLRNVSLPERVFPVGIAGNPSQRGAAFASVRNDKTLHFWSSQGTPLGEPVTLGVQDGDALKLVRFSRNGEYLAVAWSHSYGQSTSQIQVFDVEKRTATGPPFRTQGAIIELAFGPEARTIAVASAVKNYRHAIHLYTRRGFLLGPLFVALEGEPKSLLFDSSGNVLTSVDAHGLRRRWYVGFPAMLAVARERYEGLETRERVEALIESASSSTDDNQRAGLLEKARALDPENATVRVRLGNAYAGPSQEQRRKALVEYDKATGLAPYSPVNFMQRGKLRYWMGDYTGAIDDFGAALTYDYMYLRATIPIATFMPINEKISDWGWINLAFGALWFNQLRGRAHLAQENWPEAEHDFTLVLEGSPELRAARINALDTATRQEDNAWAEQLRAQLSDPVGEISAENYELRARARLAQGKLDTAESDFRMAMTLLQDLEKPYGHDTAFAGPSKDPAWRARKIGQLHGVVATIHDARKETTAASAERDKAVEQLNKAHQLAPENPWILLERGRAKLDIRADASEVIEDYVAAVDADPGNQAVQARLVQILIWYRQFCRAYRDASRFVQHQSQPTAMLVARLAIAASQTGRHDEARETIRNLAAEPSGLHAATETGDAPLWPNERSLLQAIQDAPTADDNKQSECPDLTP